MSAKTSAKTLVLGGKGMLGKAVGALGCGAAEGFDPLAVGRAELDLTQTSDIAALLDGGAIDTVLNCAAFTAVDACETEVDTAMEVNGYAVGRLAEVCASRGVRLIHISTDYVFAGDGIRETAAGSPRPYREQDAVAPVSVYGKSKELGERLALDQGALVVRASWLFGPGGNNFVQTMLRLSESGNPLKVVDDQVGCPTYTPFLAQGLVALLQWSRSKGHPENSLPREDRLFHFANPPAVSWFEFAQEIFEVFQREVDLSPCASSEYPRPAPRPAYSVLSTDRWQHQLDFEPSSWKDGLRDYALKVMPPQKSSKETESR